MQTILDQIIPNVVEYFPELMKALYETILMVTISGFLSTLIGLPLGVVLVVTRADNLLENKVVYMMLG
ncbi:MAG: ABC transporter permease, partial [Turicibacter sp.]